MGRVIGVAGATGALGREVVAALENVPWEVDAVVPLARAASKTPFVTFRNQEIAVDDLADEDLARLDLLVLALPADAAGTWGERAVHAGTPIVDCSGALASEAVPVGIPWVNPDALLAGQRVAVALPAPETLLAASVLAPLFRAGLDGTTDITFLLPASIRGRDGIAELSAQVVALFNAGTPPRKVFDSGLAFDLLPGMDEPAPGGTTAREDRIRTELTQLLDLEVAVSCVGVPVFSGLSAELRIEPSRRPVPELVRQILADAGVQSTGADAPREVPRPRRVEGQPFPSVGRIRVDERGEVLRLFAAMDNLRAAATVVVGLAGLLLQDR
jgi:aspartate-semialdehyde dehydrogenase